jgi:hypothetical protein
LTKRRVVSPPEDGAKRVEKKKILNSGIAPTMSGLRELRVVKAYKTGIRAADCKEMKHESP